MSQPEPSGGRTWESPVNYLRTFAPWIVYAVVPSAQWQWGALAALVVTLVVLAGQFRAGRGLDALIIEIGSGLFFAALTIAAFAAPHSGLHPWAPALANGALALIAAISLLIRRPFTLGIAKIDTPREFWDQPIFIRTNTVITSVWTASFAISAVALAFAVHSGTALRSTLQVAGFVVPMVFTIRYVAHVKAKVAAILGQSV